MIIKSSTALCNDYTLEESRKRLEVIYQRD